MRMNNEELPILSAEVKHRAKTWSLNQTRILKTRFSIGSEYSDESPYPSTPHDQLVWYPHPKHAWLLGKIVSENASRYTVVPIPSGTSIHLPAVSIIVCTTQKLSQVHLIKVTRYEASRGIKHVLLMHLTSTR